VTAAEKVSVLGKRATGSAAGASIFHTTYVSNDAHHRKV
jgi:hypothetical protein